MSLQELTKRELELLDFERDWPSHEGRKRQSIEATFGFSSSRYYQLLNGLTYRQAAQDHDPLLVRRLRRRKDERSTRSTTLGLSDQRDRGQTK